MILKDTNQLYDVRLYYYTGVSFSEKCIINVLDWYGVYADDEITVIVYDEYLDEVTIRKYSYGAILNSYKRDDVLLVFRKENKIKFEIMTINEVDNVL